ncbi:hypothetical protein D9758_008387 [Tetrapyrgos nigripes]|uniref:Uncharacterized protein n=1 Tax=Tetrapyrgos nigripes TaxID=182062 RepID=A0A8H5GE25_9AGAR|nr:hypothetical protein D9758_008387 [Tetrapyrgos nigripes]
MIQRERRYWTANEDQLLLEAIRREDPANPNPSRWHAISQHVPNRTNKDCRKRWITKMVGGFVKGGWSPEEDEKLMKAIERHGYKWSSVATAVQTRSSEQCAKRWKDTLDPNINREAWTPEADDLLIRAVQNHGKLWSKIVKCYFPGRTGLSAKNRYNSLITRSSTGSHIASGSQTPLSSSSTSAPLPSRYPSESISSSSSNASPVMPLPRTPESAQLGSLSSYHSYSSDDTSTFSESRPSSNMSSYPRSALLAPSRPVPSVQSNSWETPFTSVKTEYIPDAELIPSHLSFFPHECSENTDVHSGHTGRNFEHAQHEEWTSPHHSIDYWRFQNQNHVAIRDFTPSNVSAYYGMYDPRNT